MSVFKKCSHNKVTGTAKYVAMFCEFFVNCVFAVSSWIFALGRFQKNPSIIRPRERQNMTVCSRFFHPLSLCVVAPFDLDGVPPRTLSPRSLPTPLGMLAPFREVLAHFAGVSNNHPAGHSVVLFAFLFSLLFKKTVTYQYESSGSQWPPADRIDM